MSANPKDCGAGCETCPFAVKGQPNKPVRYEIPEDPVAILIGEHPSADDVTYGRPFTGQVERELAWTFEAAGLKRSQFVVACAAACKPPPGTNNLQRAAAARACKPYLMSQIKDYTHLPKLLMGTGAVIPFMPLAKGGVDAMRGFIREKEKAVVTWGPVYAFFSNPYAWGAFNADVARFGRFLRNELIGEAPRINTEPTPEDLMRMVYSQKELIVAVDIETAPSEDAKPWTGKDPLRADLRSIGFGTETEGLSFMWADASMRMRTVTKEILEDPAVTKVWQNGAWFDRRVLRRFGMVSVNNEDTRDLRRALSATSELSLRYIASLYCDIPPWKESEDDK